MQMSAALQHPEIPAAAAADLALAKSGNVFAELDHLGVLRISGGDAADFLQGQLTCDVENLLPGAGIFGAWCSAKGRMLATFLLWRSGDDFFMALSRDVLPSIEKRLSMFVLRSKVKISDATQSRILLGASGPGAPAAVRGAAPAETVGLHDGRFIVSAEAAQAGAVRRALASGLRPAGAHAWRWLDIRAGFPWIVAATQDQLVPQMANLELLGGVSFSKGCYAGQEVVARAQHLGKVKRRMFLANAPAAAVAGDSLYSEDLGDQASGLVVGAEVSPDGGWDLLAVVGTASRETSTVHLKSLDGPALRFLPLPYAVA